MKSGLINKNLSGFVKGSYKILLCTLPLFLFSCQKSNVEKPNVLFIMMDDLGYGQLGINNDTLKTSDFDPFYVQLEERYQGY